MAKIRQPRYSQEVFDEVVRLAMAGHRVSEIEEIMRGTIPFDTIRAWITEARKAGFLIPRQIPRPVAEQAARDKPAPEPQPLTTAEQRMIARHVERGTGLTAIAAMLRRPYAMVAAEIDRQKKSA